jgi:hypothetical protein
VANTSHGDDTSSNHRSKRNSRITIMHRGLDMVRRRKGVRVHHRHRQGAGFADVR